MNVAKAYPRRAAGAGALARPEPGAQSPHGRNRPHRGRPAPRTGRRIRTAISCEWMIFVAPAAQSCWRDAVVTQLLKLNVRVAGKLINRAPSSAPLSAMERPCKGVIMGDSIGLRLRSEGEKAYLRNEAGDVIGFGDAAYRIQVIPVALARETIRANHYSQTIVNNSYIHLGVYWRGDFAGALQFGYAMVPNSGRKVVAETENRQYLELNRMWVSDLVPANGESMAIAYAIRFIRAKYPGVKWIQSFADERCGRWGVVYQAANFEYLGFHWSDFWRLDGEWYHDLLVTAHKKGGGRGRYLRENIARAEKHRFRQFRYIRFLDPRARRRLLKPLVTPYPKPEPAR